MSLVQAFATLIARILLALAGGMLIYSSVFLYETEEGRLENALERWWNKVRVLQNRAVSFETAFLKVVAEITSKAFALLFGERLFGPKAIAASISYSVAALFAYSLISWLSLYGPGPTQELFWEIFKPRQIALFGNYVTDVLKPSSFPTSTRGVAVVTFLCAIFVLMGSLGPLIHRRVSKLVWLACVVIIAVSLPLIGFSRGFLLSLSFALPFAVASNFLVIAFTRTTLRRAAASDWLIKIVAYSVASVVAAYVLFAVPGRVLGWTEADWIRHNNPLREEPLFLGTSFLMLRASNFFGLVVSLAWLLVVVLMLAQRLVWPVVERPIYALNRYKVFTQQKKLVFFCGLTLLGIAIPAVGHAIENLVTSLHI